jgi:DNA-binding Lrp family transcriptional regulator
MTLENIIHEYGEQLHIPDAREKNTVLRILTNFFNQQDNLNSDVQLILNNLTEFLGETADGIQSYRKDKNKLNNCIRDFLLFLSSRYNITIDIETYFPQLKFMEKTERMIEILKYLHEEPKTREEIAQRFGISERALSGDLSELQNGSYSFLGYNMKINLRRGDNTYDSTIHPVFLPLNLSEVYALTIGLKLSGKGTAFEDVFNYVSDCIYDQLSNYGQRRISEKAKATNVHFSDAHKKAYRYEEDILNANLKQKRSQMIAYYLKSGALCEIEYDTAEGIKTVTGRVNLAKDNRKGFIVNRLQVTNHGQMEAEVDLDKVLTIKLVNDWD